MEHGCVFRQPSEARGMYFHDKHPGAHSKAFISLVPGQPALISATTISLLVCMERPQSLANGNGSFQVLVTINVKKQNKNKQVRVCSWRPLSNDILREVLRGRLHHKETTGKKLTARKLWQEEGHCEYSWPESLRYHGTRGVMC